MTAVRHPLSRSFAVLAVAVSMLGAGSAAAKTKVAASQLSDEIIVVDGTAMVPVDDLIATVGCTLKVEATTRFYEAWPCRPIGTFRVDADAIAAYAKSTTGSGERELHFGEHVVSRAVVLHEGRAYLELGEIAKLMGGKVKGKGKKARIVIGDGSVRVIKAAGG